MKSACVKFPESRGELIEKIISDAQEIERLSEENRLLRQALFAPKTEKKRFFGDSLQLNLFDIQEELPADGGEDDDQAEEIVVPAHTRRTLGAHSAHTRRTLGVRKAASRCQMIYPALR